MIGRLASFGCMLLLLAACASQASPTAQSLPAANVSLAQNLSLAEGTVQIGEQIPELSYEQAGKKVALSDFRGKVVVLNFWQTTCVPCRTEMPDFEAIARERQDVVFIGVNKDENAEVVQRFASEIGVSYVLPLDRDGSISQAFNVNYLPTTYFIDPNGLVQKIHVGAISRSQTLKLISDFGQP
ncbi:MAG: TlpA family protein disulfide reductase [Chloroflexi bacterium]|nr:TlpA family protein disulfide reductase [Chloroflexota bacterium]